MKRVFTWPRLILLTVAAIVLAAWWVPKLNAERYREPIHDALEAALNRKIKIGTIRFQLLPTPGFTLKDVIVSEDPALGPEPVAYVTTLRARPTMLALLGGHLAFASVDLEDTSVNLTRVESDSTGVRWNFSALGKAKLSADFPVIHMVGGRVNFKFGDTKSIFYLLNTDVDLWPPDRADGPWTVKIRAQPARTDRPSRGFADFTARGQWEPRSNAVTLDAKLEPSELGDMVTLFQGSESNLHGHIAGSAHLAGPMQHVGVSGKIMVDEIHGWNQTPPGGAAWPLAIDGAIDLPGQNIDLRATIAGRRNSPLDVRYHVTNYLGRPAWNVNTTVSKLPVAPLADIARNLGAPVPADLKVDGSVDGAVSYAFIEGAPQMSGEVHLSDASLGFPNVHALKVAPVSLQFAGSTVTVAATSMTNDANETASFAGAWDAASRGFTASLASTGMSIGSLRRQAGAVGVPILSQAVSGMWSGELDYSAEDGGWKGDAHLSDAVLAFEAFSEPLTIVSADVSVDGADVSMKPVVFRIGAVEGQGDYAYRAAAERPHHFHVALTRATGSELERLLMPALHRGTFLNYAFNFGRVPEPGWMQGMHADGTIQANALPMGDVEFTRVKSRVLWDGEDVRFAGLEATVASGVLTGIASADLSQRRPAYTVSGKLSGYAWRNGTLTAEGTLATDGTGGALLTNLSAKGSFRGRHIAAWDVIAGCFDLARNSAVRVTQLTATSGRETVTGTAEAQPGQLTVQMDGKSKPVVVQFR